MSIQPAEFAKLAVVTGMALVVAERTEGSWRRRDVGHLDVLGMLGIAALPALLILLQPDLGTMLVLVDDRLRGDRRLRGPAAMAGRAARGRRGCGVRRGGRSGC